MLVRVDGSSGSSKTERVPIRSFIGRHAGKVKKPILIDDSRHHWLESQPHLVAIGALLIEFLDTAYWCQ